MAASKKSDASEPKGEPAAADPNPIEHGVPTDPPPASSVEPTTSKADIKLRDLYDELEQLKAAGNTQTPRFAEVKALIAKAGAS